LTCGGKVQPLGNLGLLIKLGFATEPEHLEHLSVAQQIQDSLGGMRSEPKILTIHWGTTKAIASFKQYL